MSALDAYVDPGPVVRLVGGAEGARRAETFGFLVLGAVPLSVVLLLLDGDLFDRLTLAAAVTIFVVAASLGCAGSLGGRVGWLVPALLRAAEYVTVIRVTAVIAPDAVPAAYAFCAALAYHHYDTVYRIRHTQEWPASWVFLAGGGFDARMLAVALLALGGAAWLSAGLWVLAAVTGALFVTESVTGWLRWTRRSGVPTTDDVNMEVD